MLGCKLTANLSYPTANLSRCSLESCKMLGCKLTANLSYPTANLSRCSLESCKMQVLKKFLANRLELVSCLPFLPPNRNCQNPESHMSDPSGSFVCSCWPDRQY
jgi:hypothetical protein